MIVQKEERKKKGRKEERKKGRKEDTCSNFCFAIFASCCTFSLTSFFST